MALKNLLSDLENGLNAYPNHNTPSTSGGFNYGESTTRIFDSKNFRQKTFEFGKDNAFDRPGEEFSREPFIKSPLGGSTTGSDGLDSALDFVDAFTDGLVRGGIATAVERSVKDVVRIGKFYLSYRGINFLTKQTFTITDMKASIQIENLRTTAPITTELPIQTAGTPTAQTAPPIVPAVPTCP